MIVLLLWALAAAPDAGTPRVLTPQTFKEKVVVNAEKLEILGKSNEAIWTGKVRAERGTTKLACDRLVAHYTADQQVSSIECVGNVEIKDGERWAKGERADFDNERGVLVVTGNPEARQGSNHMRGSKVTFYLEKDLVEVRDAHVTVESVGPPEGKKRR